MINSIDEGRQFLKAFDWDAHEDLMSDQQKKVPFPPQQKPYPPDSRLIDLTPPDKCSLGKVSLIDIITQRRSRRKFTGESLTMEELSFLLWTTQGVQRVFREGLATFRTSPSGGARHPFETYLYVQRCESLTEGIYRYLPLDHKLLFLFTEEGLAERLVIGCHDQGFVSEAPVTFIWTTIPYRTEWRYSLASHKTIALDAGHVCQNLYLAAESIGAGACAIAAYRQEEMDRFLKLDGENEFTIYISPVGKIGNPESQD